MTNKVISALLLSGLALVTVIAPALAAGKKAKGHSSERGGYSYDYVDSINTYGDSRSKYGSASSYRDPNLDRQTNAGPFDHGFFFDSGMGERGGDSPYMH